MTPRSPCRASAGCRKIAAVPVLVSVAAILRAMRPDLPMPVTITRPAQLRSRLTAQSKRSSSRSTSARIAAASVCSTFRARARPWTVVVPAALSFGRSAMHARLGALRNRVDRHQPLEQRLQQVEPQRVLRVTLRAARVLVHLEEDAVDAGGDAGRRERLDVFREARGDAVAAAGELQ